jgi:hypothetical protein
MPDSSSSVWLRSARCLAGRRPIAEPKAKAATLRQGSFVAILLSLMACAAGWSAEPVTSEAARAYRAGPFAFLSQDYFARFSRDTAAKPGPGEMTIGPSWEIVVCADAAPLTSIMAGHLAEFLKDRMDLALPIRHQKKAGAFGRHTIALLDHDGSSSGAADSFAITVARSQVTVKARNATGLRDGVVQLVDRIGFRAAPILELGEVAYAPRLGLRLGAVPWMGTYRDAVFFGYNGVIVTAGVDTRQGSATSLTSLSTSRAIDELVPLQKPALLARIAENAREARRYGLRPYCALQMWDGYPASAPLFTNHPGLRGAEILYFTDRPPVGFIPCTENPLMRRYLTESIRGLLQAAPLDGVLIIIGGEVFQHCYMRPAGVKKGHTNCQRCEQLGADTVVANLCNHLAQAARTVNPDARLVAWPYSANHYWSAEDDQAGLIHRLQCGTAILTEIEKDETLTKEGGVIKPIWDYSIDLIGPTARARRQIAASKAQGIEVYLKSEPELAFEAPGLPYIPCLDRWYERAEALAAAGADGAWVFPWFQACYGTTSAEVYKYAWWSPNKGEDVMLAQLARRIAGPQAAAHLRQAWGYVSEAVGYSPEMPSYFTGPYFLGPAHPMCADRNAELPKVFQGKHQFASHVLTAPTGAPDPCRRAYRKMEQALMKAVEQLDAAEPKVLARCRLTFQAEALPTRWFYHIARTHANFYESCQLRDFFTNFASGPHPSAADIAEAQTKYDRWRGVLIDERANTLAAIPVVEGDPRLDVRNGVAKILSPAPEMMRAKLALLDHELSEFLPSIARRCGLDPRLKP